MVPDSVTTYRLRCVGVSMDAAVVFVYGTLTDPERAGEVLDEYEFRGGARLAGLHRVDGQYPTLAPGGETDGRLLWTPEVPALDSYEGIDSGLYIRVSVPLVGGECDTVEVYVGDPDRLAAPADWPGDGPFPERVRAHLREHDVRVLI